jgi:hypothetical protein
MSTSFFFSFGLLISFLLCFSCSLIYNPVDEVSNQETNHPYYNTYKNNEDDNDVPLMIYPKSSSMYHLQRSALNHPRASRNSWFRVSTYQHMKPTAGAEDKPARDNLMRWG